MVERCVKDFMSKTERKRLLVRPSRRWDDNTKMVVQRMVWGLGLNFTAAVKVIMVRSCECYKGNSGSKKCWYLLTS
jgi:hypothetical protein